MPRILVVEPETHIQYALHDVLTLEGYEVAVADHAAAAVEVVQQAPVDLALVEMTLAKPDGGFELASELKSLQPIPVVAIVEPPVLFGTAQQWPHFDAILPKPWDWGELLATIQRLIGGHERGMRPARAR